MFDFSKLIFLILSNANLPTLKSLLQEIAIRWKCYPIGKHWRYWISKGRRGRMTFTLILVIVFSSVLNAVVYGNPKYQRIFINARFVLSLFSLLMIFSFQIANFDNRESSFHFKFQIQVKCIFNINPLMGNIYFFFNTNEH